MEKDNIVKSNIIIYQTEDGKIKIETHFENETVWLSQIQICELFQKSKATISEHIKNIFDERELERIATVRKFRTVRIEGSREVNREIDLYNLDMIISVGYRVKSLQGVQFRKWATKRIKDYLVKGFAMNDELLKNIGGGEYFEELLARIRDIRSSEKVFWRKVLDIYATSIDYEADSDLSIKLFKTIQNKMHWAAHGKTAAEVIYQRVNNKKKNIGLTNFQGNNPTKQEAEIAKNYLTESELNILNRMVTAFLEIAEIQALNKVPMHMKDWLEQLDSFLQMTGKDILNNAGKISHKQALKKAHTEYDKFKEQNKNALSRVEKDFIKEIENTSKKLENKNGK